MSNFERSRETEQEAVIFEIQKLCGEPDANADVDGAIVCSADLRQMMKENNAQIAWSEYKKALSSAGVGENEAEEAVQQFGEVTRNLPFEKNSSEWHFVAWLGNRLQNEIYSKYMN